MKTIKLFLVVTLAMLAAQFSRADIVGNYTADTNTLFLLHFDEAAGGTFTTNNGSKAGKFYSVTEAAASATPATVTTMLGGAGYVNGATNFHNCMTNPTTGYEFGYDANNSGAYQGEGSAPCPDAIAMTNLNIGFGGQSPFTLEALVRPNQIAAGTQEIICTDSSAGGRAFQFRFNAGTVQFQFINGAQALSGTIPASGNDAFVAGNWYHVALTYNGTTATIYWTLLNPTNGAAHVLASAALALGTTAGATTGPLIIGNENRAAANEQFQGMIDEVRISSVARASGQMQFYSPLVTITANPVSQNVDYNQPVNFSVGASSQFALGYQWRFNSNSIAGFTNSAFTITNVASFNAGYYDCVVTNTSGFAATSSPALLVVGAANFLANRYSFTTDTSDSVGGQWGTNFGSATVAGGKLVLDGTTDCFMQLPPNLFTAANATALTVEFWATYGTNPNNVYAFAFGKTNFVSGQGIIGFNFVHYSPHNGVGQTASSAPGDPLFSQSVNAAGNLDGRTVHVAVVFDPPNKLLSIYTNGVLEAVNTNFTVNISSLNNQLSYIGKSLWVADPLLNASIDEIRIFKGALSSITIKQSDDQGPNTLLADGPAKYTLQPVSASVPAGQTATFSAATVGYLPITYQWFKSGSPIAGATNASVSFTALIGDNGAPIFCHATNTIGVTTYISNSTTATLTVFIPPTLTWYGSVNNLWDTATLNWNNGLAAFAQTNGVLFDSNGSSAPGVDIAQVTLPYNIAVNAVTDYTFASSSGNGTLIGAAAITKSGAGRLTIDVTNNLSGPVTISGGTIQVGNSDSLGSLGSSVVTNNAALSFNRGDTALNVANTIHGSGVVSFDGSGAVTVSGNNDYTGSTAINSGITFLLSPTGLGATSGNTTIANGAQLYVTANVDVAEPLSLNGVGDGNGALRKGAAGLTTEAAPVTLASDSTIGVDSGATLTLSNVVSGAFALTSAGVGTLALNANNSFTGGFTLNGSIVGLNANGALGTAPATVAGTGRFVLGTGVTIANAIHATIVSPGASTGLIMVNDNTNGLVTTVSGPLTFDVSPANGGDFFGPTTSGYLNITGPVTNATTGVISSRNGFVRYSGGGNYTLFILNQGTASIGANNGLCPNASLTIGASGGAGLDLNGFSQALAGITDGAANVELLTNSAATPSTLTFNLTAANTYNGLLGGKLALVVNGPGSLLLNASNTYTGNTTVNGGTLELAQPALATNSTVTVATGATLQLDFAGTNTVAGLVMNSVSASDGVYNAGNSSPFISGSGSLLVAHSLTNSPGPSAGGGFVVNSVDGHILTVRFHEALSSAGASATTIANYTAYGKAAGSLTITNAVLLGDNQSVALYLNSTAGEFFAVGVSNVLDAAGSNIVSTATGYLTSFVSTNIGTVGNPSLLGEAIKIGGGTYQITANGSDIGGTDDHCQLVADTMTGDFETIASVTRLDATDNDAKICLMARESTGTGSRSVMLGFTPLVPGLATNRVVMLARTSNGGSAIDFGVPPQLNSLGWLRLMRTGNLFTAYYATNSDQNWIQCGSVSNVFATNLLVGLAVTSHANGQMTTAGVTSFGVAGKRFGSDVVPTMSFSFVSNNIIAKWQRTPRDYTVQVTDQLVPSSPSTSSNLLAGAWAYVMLPVFDTSLTGTNSLMTTNGRYMSIPINLFSNNQMFVRLVQVEKVIPDPLGVTPGTVLSSGNVYATNNSAYALGAYFIATNTALYAMEIKSNIVMNVTNYTTNTTYILTPSSLTNYTFTTEDTDPSVHTILQLRKYVSGVVQFTAATNTTGANTSYHAQASVVGGTNIGYGFIVASTNNPTSQMGVIRPNTSTPILLKINITSP